MFRSCRRVLREINRKFVPSPILFFLRSLPKRPERPWRNSPKQLSTAKKDAAKIRQISSSYLHSLLHPQIGRRKKDMQMTVQNICDVLLSRRGQGHDMENALTQLRFRSTEECVIKVLEKLHKDDPQHHNVLVGLRFFDWAGNQRNYRHTTAAYYALFKTLCEAKSTKTLLHWLESFQRKGNVQGHRFYETLVLGYALAGQSDVALQMFGRMRFQGLDLDRIGYNVLLKALVDGNCFDVVEVICKRIGRFQNSSTDWIMMTNLCKRGKLDEAKQLLHKVRENGSYIVEESAVSLLITSLCKGKRSSEALALIQEMRKEGRVSMSKLSAAFIRGLIEANKVDDALKFFEKAKNFRGFGGCYNALLSGLLAKNRVDKFYLLRKDRAGKVYNLLNEMKKKHVFPDSCTLNELVCFFCQRGMLDIALDFFNKIGFSLHKATYDMLIHALCRTRKLDEARRVLEDEIAAGFTPSKQSFDALVELLQDSGKLDEMQGLIDGQHSTCDRFHSVLCNAGKVGDRFLVPSKMRNYVVLNKNTYFALIYGFCAVKRGEMAFKLWFEMQAYGHCPNRRILRSVIKVLCETGRSAQVLELLYMHLLGSPPNANLYNAFLDGLCNAGHSDIATFAFNKMREKGCPPNIKIYMTLLNGYLECGKVVEALNFFGSLSAKHSPRTRLYSVLISGLCKAGKLELALSFWEEMTCQEMIPKRECCEDLIYVLCMIGMINEALKILGDINAKSRRSSSYMYNIILLHSFKARELNWSRVLFQLLYTQRFNPVAGTLSTLIGGISEKWNLEDILGLLKELIDQFFVPNVVTFNLIIGALCKHGEMEVACNLFNDMSKRGCTPNVWTYDILVHGFCKVDRVNEAQVFMDEMISKRYRPSIWTYNLFRSLTNKGK